MTYIIVLYLFLRRVGTTTVLGKRKKIITYFKMSHILPKNKNPFSDLDINKHRTLIAAEPLLDYFKNKNEIE